MVAREEGKDKRRNKMTDATTPAPKPTPLGYGQSVGDPTNKENVRFDQQVSDCSVR